MEQEGVVPTCIALRGSLLLVGFAGLKDWMRIDVDWAKEEFVGGVLEGFGARQVVKEGTGSLSIRGDGKLVLAGGWDGHLRVFDFKKKKMRALAVLVRRRDCMMVFELWHMLY